MPHLLLGNQVALKTAAPQPTGSENGVRLDVEVTHSASHVVILSQNLPDFEIFSTEGPPVLVLSSFGGKPCVSYTCVHVSVSAYGNACACIREIKIRMGEIVSNP